MSQIMQAEKQGPHGIGHSTLIHNVVNIKQTKLSLGIVNINLIDYIIIR